MLSDAARSRLHTAIVRLADGDRSVFPELFAELWPLILNFVRRALRDSPDAQDVAQQAMVNICFRAAEFDRTRDGVRWAFGVAAWEVRTFHRKRVRRREDGDDALMGARASGPSQEEALIEQDLTAALAEVVEQLPVRDREALATDRSSHEPPASATQRKRRERAIARLRALWKQRYE